MATIPFLDSIDPFLLSLSENGSPDNTVRAYRADLTQWMEWCRTIDPEFTELKNMARQWITQGRQDWKPKTTLRKISSIRAYGRFIGVDLLVGYRAPKPADPIPHPIPEGIGAVLDMLTEAKTDDQKALVVLTGLCGCRVSEARSIKWADINWLERTVLVRGKGDKERYVPLSELAFYWLTEIGERQALLGDERWDTPCVNLSDRGARLALTQLGKRCGLSRPIASHDMRATFATTAANKTGNLRVVQELLGHASLKTTEVYTGVSLKQKREAVEIV